MRYILLLLFATFALTAASEELDHLSDEFIHSINSKQSKWKARRNFHKDTPLSFIKGLLGAINLPHNLTNLEYDAAVLLDLPDTFDARDKWPQCKSLREIRDQGACGCCWAVCSVEMMTDRYCIASNGTKNFHFSLEDVVTCCTRCGSGCHGGSPAAVMDEWKNHGIVSGGNYGSNEGCRPYSMHPCDHVNKEAMDFCGDYKPTPPCKRTCQENYQVSYNDDLKYASTAYTIKNEQNIMAELVNKGPVTTFFQVYSDFLHYSGGVYRHTTGDYLADHAVKIIGYGAENGDKYWLVANSWNDGWGDKGYFKILRGSNECEFEEHIATGDPKM